MSEYTYEFPDPDAFLYTLREYFVATGQEHISSLLSNARCGFTSSGSFSGIRWDSYSATLRLWVPLEQLPSFSDPIKTAVLVGADSIFPLEAGYELVELQLSVHLIPPPDDQLSMGNSAVTATPGGIEHDGLRFRSRTETRIYDALKERNVLFFANATAVLGGKGIKREPDFLICQDGKWGILEVMGDQYHPSATAMRDHDRARLFKDYGLLLIEFYGATRCYNDPKGVVTDFLARLNRL